MRVSTAVLAFLLFATSLGAADPTYLDTMVETPLATLQTQFPNLKKEGCYKLAENRYLLISIDKKDQKPWRVALTMKEPCRRPVDIPFIDVQARIGINLGDSPADLVRIFGSPDAASRADASMKKLGDMEYFFLCRVEEGCARHTSVFITDGQVTAISEWYSE